MNLKRKIGFRGMRKGISVGRGSHLPIHGNKKVEVVQKVEKDGFFTRLFKYFSYLYRNT